MTKKKIKSQIYEFLESTLPVGKRYELEYWRIYGRKPNLKNPKRLTEKLFWMTRYNELYEKELIQRIYDKHLVRDYVREKGLEKILIPEIGVYDTADDIDFNKLPSEFILKSTQSSGENIICVDKSCINPENVKKKFNEWLKIDQRKYGGIFRYYFTKERKILCEELLRDDNGGIPNDLRVCCCNGEPQFIYCDLESIDPGMNKRKQYYRECFDTEWNYLPVDFHGRERKNKEKALTPKPDNLKEVLETAKILSRDFLFVRVDFYNIKGKIYFGELTPVPGLAGGFSPDEYDYIFGDMLELPDIDVFHFK